MIQRRIYIFFSILLMVLVVKSQRHELGIYGGMGNVVGDIGSTFPITTKFKTYKISYEGIPFSGGLTYRMNFNPYQTVRLNLGYNNVVFDDSEAREEGRKSRGLSGSNKIYEVSAMFEYKLFPINDEQKSMLSPYIFGGFGAILYKSQKVGITHDFHRTSAGVAINPTSAKDFVTHKDYTEENKMSFSIPFGVGLKYKFNYNWAVYGEITFRPTFTDALDHSYKKEEDIRVSYNGDIMLGGQSLLETGVYANEAESRVKGITEIGNTNNKDWLNSITLGVSFSFGRPPCYCN